MKSAIFEGLALAMWEHAIFTVGQPCSQGAFKKMRLGWQQGDFWSFDRNISETTEHNGMSFKSGLG